MWCSTSYTSFSLTLNNHRTKLIDYMVMLMGMICVVHAIFVSFVTKRVLCVDRDIHLWYLYEVFIVRGIK